MLTIENYFQAVSLVGIELKEHDDPARGWTWRIQTLTDWDSGLHESEHAALAGAMVWLLNAAIYAQRCAYGSTTPSA